MRSFLKIVLALLVALYAAVAWPRAVRGEVSSEQVKNAIEKGVRYLRGTNLFRSKGGHGIGMNALAVLAMLHCGVPPADPDVVRGAELCANPANWTPNTYHVGCVAAALAAVDAKKYKATIEKCANWLIEAQNQDGGWRYESQGKAGARGNQQSDHSCTQFALLGLRAADDAGVPIPEATWKAAEKYLLDTQGADGGWGYTLPNQGTYGSMSAAGLGSLYICGMRLHQRAEKCGEYEENKRLAAGLNWMATHFSVKDNPGRGRSYVGYYLYTLERVCAFSGQKHIGVHDWYAEGAEHLVNTQPANGSWGAGGQFGFNMGDLDTIFNLLFLGKASSRILIQKLEYGPGWNTDYFDTEDLTRRASQDLDLKCTWQTVRLEDKVEGWLEAPILYITGHGKLAFTEPERAKVREFCERGGTVVADACCGNEIFDKSFRAEMALIFPTVPLAEIPEGHPVYQVPHKIAVKNHMVWEGITTGCRTAVFYSKRDLSCAWDGNTHGHVWPVQVDEVTAMRLGVNVAAYAVGYRPLKEKLDEVQAEIVKRDVKDDGRVARGALVFAQLKHDGDWDPDPSAARSMLFLYAKNTGARVNLKRVDLDPTDPELYKYPFLYMTGHNEFTYTDAQVKALREYFQRGGFMFADACCGRDKFDRAFRALVKRIFPDKNLERLPPDHKVFRMKYTINIVQYRPILKKELPDGERDMPRLEAVVLDGRAVLVYSPYDVGCAFEGFPCAMCRGMELESAEQVLTNVLLYGMTE